MPRTAYFFPVRVGGGSDADPVCVRPSVRPCVRAGRPAGPPLHTKNTLKRSKPLKINGLGRFGGIHLHSFFGRNLKKYAPMQRGVRFDMCPFGTGAFYMGSEKRSKHFKINGLGCFREAFFLTHLDHPNCESVPMQRGARFFVPPERSHAAWRSFCNF